MKRRAASHITTLFRLECGLFARTCLKSRRSIIATHQDLRETADMKEMNQQQRCTVGRAAAFVIRVCPPCCEVVPRKTLWANESNYNVGSFKREK